jgi:hypothetical protein
VDGSVVIARALIERGWWSNDDFVVFLSVEEVLSVVVPSLVSFCIRRHLGKVHVCSSRPTWKNRLALSGDISPLGNIQHVPPRPSIFHASSPTK